jgi:Ser/Thr protein kinase RdoA (MazF antagonist)
MRVGDQVAHDVDRFMATMVAQSPPVPIDRVVDFVRQHYGLKAQAVRLTGERDENFKLTDPGGTEYVLKIAPAAEDPAVTDLATAALLHVEITDPSFPCPRVVRARAGSTHVRFEAGANVERIARMVSYLPGRPIDCTTRSRKQRIACGRIAGRLCKALRTFDHPAAHRVLIWDLRHASQVAQLLDQIPDFPCRQAATAVLTGLVPRIDSRLPRLRQQAVHNDLNSHNILVDPSDAARVTGVIDFGDMVHTALVADVAVTAADLLPDDCATDARRARDAVLDVATAYHEVVPLLDAELALLSTLVAARVVANMVVPAWHLHHNPHTGHYAAHSPDLVRAWLETGQALMHEEIKL